MKPHLPHMKAAIEIAEKHQTPFGAVLAMGDQLFVAAANQTGELHDPTAHAEIMAIRELGKQIKKTDFSGFALYTTCEPCAMCMSAAIWARVKTVYYGCSIPLISKYLGQIDLRAEMIAESGFSSTYVQEDIMVTECEQLLKKYS